MPNFSLTPAQHAQNQRNECEKRCQAYRPHLARKQEELEQAHQFDLNRMRSTIDDASSALRKQDEARRTRTRALITNGAVIGGGCFFINCICMMNNRGRMPVFSGIMGFVDSFYHGSGGLEDAILFVLFIMIYLSLFVLPGILYWLYTRSTHNSEEQRINANESEYAQRAADMRASSMASSEQLERERVEYERRCRRECEEAIASYTSSFSAFEAERSNTYYLPTLRKQLGGVIDWATAEIDAVIAPSLTALHQGTIRRVRFKIVLTDSTAQPNGIRLKILDHNDRSLLEAQYDYFAMNETCKPQRSNLADKSAYIKALRVLILNHFGANIKAISSTEDIYKGHLELLYEAVA